MPDSKPLTAAEREQLIVELLDEAIWKLNGDDITPDTLRVTVRKVVVQLRRMADLESRLAAAEARVGAAKKLLRSFVETKRLGGFSSAYMRDASADFLASNQEPTP